MGVVGWLTDRLEWSPGGSKVVPPPVEPLEKPCVRQHWELRELLLRGGRCRVERTDFYRDSVQAQYRLDDGSVLVLDLEGHAAVVFRWFWDGHLWAHGSMSVAGLVRWLEGDDGPAAPAPVPGGET